jgi:hypothetical protein
MLVLVLWETRKAAGKLNQAFFRQIRESTFLKLRRPWRLEHALLDYLTLSQGEGTIRDLITTRTKTLGIVSRLGAKALP